MKPQERHEGRMSLDRWWRQACEPSAVACAVVPRELNLDLMGAPARLLSLLVRRPVAGAVLAEFDPDALGIPLSVVAVLGALASGVSAEVARDQCRDPELRRRLWFLADLRDAEAAREARGIARPPEMPAEDEARMLLSQMAARAVCEREGAEIRVRVDAVVLPAGWDS